jgi:hypothetical protein
MVASSHRRPGSNRSCRKASVSSPYSSSIRVSATMAHHQSHLNPDMACVYSCMGSLGALGVALGLRMSLVCRLRGCECTTAGGNKLNCNCGQWYEQQQLHQEWAPLGIGLGLALIAKGTFAKNPAARHLFALFTASRWIFTITNLVSKERVVPIIAPTMLFMYGSLGGMAALLLVP